MMYHVQIKYHWNAIGTVNKSKWDLNTEYSDIKKINILKLEDLGINQSLHGWEVYKINWKNSTSLGKKQKKEVQNRVKWRTIVGDGGYGVRKHPCDAEYIDRLQLDDLHIDWIYKSLFGTLAMYASELTHQCRI